MGDETIGNYGGSIVVGYYVKTPIVMKNMLYNCGGIRVEWSHHEKNIITHNIVKNVKTSDYTIRAEAGITLIEQNIVDPRPWIHFWFTNAIIINNNGFTTGKYTYQSDPVPIGTDNNYGNPCTWTSQKNRYNTGFTPDKLYTNGNPIHYIKISVSGINTTAGEIITVKLVTTKADGSQNTLEKSFSSDTTYYLTDEELLQLLQGDYPVTAIEAYAKTNQSTTNATVYVTVGVD